MDYVNSGSMVAHLSRGASGLFVLAKKLFVRFFIIPWEEILVVSWWDKSFSLFVLNTAPVVLGSSRDSRCVVQESICVTAVDTVEPIPRIEVFEFLSVDLDIGAPLYKRHAVEWEANPVINLDHHIGNDAWNDHHPYKWG